MKAMEHVAIVYDVEADFKKSEIFLASVILVINYI